MLNITLTSLTIFSSNYLITIVLGIPIRTVKISIKGQYCIIIWGLYYQKLGIS